MKSGSASAMVVTELARSCPWSIHRGQYVTVGGSAIDQATCDLHCACLQMAIDNRHESLLRKCAWADEVTNTHLAGLRDIASARYIISRHRHP